MSVAPSPIPDLGTESRPVLKTSSVSKGGRPLHRLGAVRQREGVTRRTVARRLNVSVSEVKKQEEETADLPLSALYGWQEALEVPVTELLAEVRQPVPSPVEDRGKLLRVMKTAATIKERARQPAMRRMAQMLVEQLVELMPELEGVGPWPAIGKSRLPSDYGQALYRRLPDEVFVAGRDCE